MLCLKQCRQSINRQINIMEQTETPARCQVCFVVSFPAEERRRIIKCIKCNLFAHAYCYLPSCKTSFFTCDPCEKSNKEERCVICEQKGLLKRVGERFAHPICLLFNSSFLVRAFHDLSFIQIESLRPKTKLKCGECGINSGYVMNCGLKCAFACHAYCAFKSNQRADSEGSWRSCYGLSHGASTYSQLFETIIFKGLNYQHNKPLKSLLSQGKQSKKPVASTLQLYCRDHSATLVECRCNDLDSVKDRWIYCDCCCRWQHTECLENQKEAEEASSDVNQKFFCLQCKVWTKMSLETSLDIPQSLPRLHIYDFVFIHLYLEANKFEVSLPLQEFVFKLPIFPGKEYVEQVYRRRITSVLLDKISLEAQLKSLLHAKGSNEANLAEGLVKLLDESRDKLLMTWILCREDLFQTNEGRVAEFSKKFGKELYKENNLKTMVELIIDFDARFKNGNFRQARQIQSIIEGNPQANKSASELKDNGSKRPSKSIKVEKPILALNDKLRKLVAMGKENSSKETLFQILGQVHGLINSPQIMPFHKDLPKIPIVYASILLKDKDAAIRYVVVVTFLQYLRGEWQKLMGNNRCQDRHAFPEKRKRLLAEAEKYYDQHILEEQNDKLKEELMREWARNEVDNLIPSREIALTEPTQIITNINFNNLSLRKVSESLEKYTQDFLANSNKKEGFAHIKELTIMQRLLNQLESLRFTKKSLFKIKELGRQSWSGEYLDFVPKIISDFCRLYEATERILSEELYRSIREQVCLFDQWKEAELQAPFDDESVERYLVYFKDIEGVKTHRFSKEVHGTIKGKFLVLVERIEEKSHFFRSEEEYKLISKWCTALKIVPRKMGEIFKKDRDFQQAFLFLKPQFDNIEATQKLDALVTEHFHYCKSKEIHFRVHQLQVLLTWVDLHKAILNKVPASLLLDEEQAQCFESQPKGKPDYYVLRELCNIMKQAKFPECQFLKNFQAIVQQGETYCQNIIKVLECCCWDYEISASLDWDRKIERENFERILRDSRECDFYFLAEIIELEIIKEKFQDAERQAQLLKVEIQRRAEVDCQSRAKNLLAMFGCLPIASSWSKFLWGLLENQRIPGLPQNLQAYIQDIEKSRRMNSWQELDNLREVIDCKLEGTFTKKNYCRKLSDLIEKNRQLNARCKPLIEKYSNKHLFSENDKEDIKRIVSEYQDMQFQDEEIVMLQLRYEHYLAVKGQMKWRQKFETNDIKTLKFLEHTVSTLHASFFTPEIEKYLAFISEQLKRAEEEKRLEEINYFNSLGRNSNAHKNTSNSPRHISPVSNNNRKDKRNGRNSPIGSARPKPTHRREKQY